MVEFWNCDPELVGNPDQVKMILERALAQAAVKVVDSTFYHFSPQGLSGVVLISESHIAIHTWPEHSYVAVDLFTCGPEPVAWEVIDILQAGLRAGQMGVMEVKRGLNTGGKSI